MTQLLEQAISHIKTLSPDRQDAIATLILEELQDEQRWEQSFARSPDLLAQLAVTAMAEYHAGQTQPLDLETLWNQEPHWHFGKPWLSYQNQSVKQRVPPIASFNKIPHIRVYGLKKFIQNCQFTPSESTENTGLSDNSMVMPWFGSGLAAMINTIGFSQTYRNGDRWTKIHSDR
jgi:hypothetical protein